MFAMLRLKQTPTTSKVISLKSDECKSYYRKENFTKESKATEDILY
jgi:predicted secreted protein